MKLEGKQQIWKDYQKEIADDRYYYARSCIRQTFFPGSEWAYLDILGNKLGKTVLLAVIVTAVTYGWVFLADYFFMTDFRLWTLAAKAFTAEKVPVILFPHLPMFLLFYVPASVAANCFNYNSIGGKKGLVNSLIVAVFTAFPALIIPWIQYIYYYSTDIMLFWGPVNRLQMYVVWLFPMVIILMAATFISRAIYKKTANPYLAGIVNAVLITTITCVNTRMYFM